MVRILDVLVTTIAARVTGDELVVEVDADPVGIGFDRQSAVSVCGGDGILIGVQGDAELAGGNTGRSVRDVVGVRVERSQMRTLLGQQIDGSLLRFAVDAQVGDGVEPDLCGRVDGAEVGQLEPMQEILFDVAHTSTRRGPSRCRGRHCRLDRKAVVAGKVQIARIEHRCGAGQALQNRRFEIVDHDFGRHASRRPRRRVRGRRGNAPWSGRR